MCVSLTTEESLDNLVELSVVLSVQQGVLQPEQDSIVLKLCCHDCMTGIVYGQQNYKSFDCNVGCPQKLAVWTQHCTETHTWN